MSRLALVVHNHQPNGNLPDLFERAHQTAYLPFLKVLQEHPTIKINLHYSGTLLQWIQKNHPSTLQLLKQLVERGQVELLAGGMHEPLLPLIPKRDRMAQISAQREWMAQHLSSRSKGVWLAECAWDTDLPETLSECGVEYTLLDDTQIPEQALPATFYMTEHDGHNVRVFVMQHQLHNQMPYAQPATIIENIRAQKQLVVLGEDGESFGLTGDTFQRCYEEGWLKGFFQALEQNRDIQLVHLSDELKQPCSGLVYVPSSSFSAPDGYFRQAMAKYAGINNLHKRMRYTSLKLDLTPRASQQAYEHLWRGQTGDAYWPTSAEYNFVRFEAYRNLIRAENEIEPRKYSWLEIDYRDTNGDGVQELIAESHTMNLHFSPTEGGSLQEWDYREKAVNLVDSYSDHPRTHPRTLVEHFFGGEVSLRSFAHGQYLELGDFSTGLFDAGKYRNRVTLSRMGIVRGPAGIPVPVELKKSLKILPKEHQIELEYRITNHGDWDIITRFGSKWNFGLLAGDSPDRYFYINGRKVGSLGSTQEHREVTHAGIVDEWLGIRVVFEFEGREATIWHYPVVCDRKRPLYQSSVFMPVFDLDLPKGRSRRLAFNVHVEEL